MTIVQDQSGINIFKAATVPLGQLSITASPRVTLYACDQAHSNLGGQEPERLQIISYGVYGHTPAHGLPTALGYNGELFDPLGVYLLGNGNRIYSPYLMRFLSPDRTGIFTPGNFNAYAYAGCDPVNRGDPSGNTWKWHGTSHMVNTGEKRGFRDSPAFSNKKISDAHERQISASKYFVSEKRKLLKSGKLEYNIDLNYAKLTQRFGADVLENMRIALDEVVVVVASGRYNSELNGNFLPELLRPFMEARDQFFKELHTDYLSVFKEHYSSSQYTQLERVMLDSKKKYDDLMQLEADARERNSRVRSARS